MRVRLSLPPLPARSLEMAATSNPQTHLHLLTHTTRVRVLQHCDLYVVRLLPAGHQLQGVRGENNVRDPTRFGNSKPCLRCLHALMAVGVHRVIFTSGERVGPQPDALGEHCIPCEVRTVHELLLESCGEGQLRGHSSRGDVEAAHVCGYHAMGVPQAAGGHASQLAAVGRMGAPAADAAKVMLGFG